MQNNYDDAQKIIDATDIVALVSKYVKLEKQGKNYKGLCPFHNEDTPSFVVSPDKKLAHCFGCGGGGNPVNFLMQIENISFNEAIKELADFNGMEYKGKVEVKKASLNQKYFDIMQVATDFYKQYFSSTYDGELAKKYLLDRGLDEETIATFNIGLSPDIGDTLYKVLKASDFLELDMADCALVDKNVTGYHDLFCNRIMFPICDIDGHPVAFSGRIYKNKDLKDKNSPKYINSRETRIFHKGEILFNFHLAKGYMMKKKRVILHEGQMDVIASYRSNLQEAICTMGTALTDPHIKLIERFTKSVIICFDSDSAGINASRKAINLFKNHGFQIHLVLMENAKDPDEFVHKYGKEAYKDFIENHLLDSNQYLYQTAFINRDLSDYNVIENIKNEVFGLIQNMQSNTEQEDYLNRLKDDLKVSLNALKLDYENYRNNHAIPKAIDIYGNNPYYDDIIPDFQYEDIIEPVKVKKEWNSICELRLIMYARSSKSLALIIDHDINQYFYLY